MTTFLILSYFYFGICFFPPNYLPAKHNSWFTKKTRGCS